MEGVITVGRKQLFVCVNGVCWRGRWRGGYYSGNQLFICVNGVCWRGRWRGLSQWEGNSCLSVLMECVGGGGGGGYHSGNQLFVSVCVLCNTYITGTRDVWHLLHRSTRAQSARGLRAINAMHPECA